MNEQRLTVIRNSLSIYPSCVNFIFSPDPKIELDSNDRIHIARGKDEFAQLLKILEATCVEKSQQPADERIFVWDLTNEGLSLEKLPWFMDSTQILLIPLPESGEESKIPGLDDMAKLLGM